LTASFFSKKHLNMADGYFIIINIQLFKRRKT
jgi:hypothetical protein